MYKEIAASEKVKDLIDSFWTFSDNTVSQSFKVLPDTCMDLIIDLNQNKVFISGLMTNYQQRVLVSKSNLIGIRFKAENLGILSEISVLDIKNQRIDLSSELPIFNLYLLGQLNDLQSLSGKLDFLENLLLIAFNKNYKKQDKMVLSVAYTIRKLKGNLSIEKLAKSNHISLRQLERRFKNYIGLTLKEFSNIVRFDHTIKVIKNFTGKSLLKIAFDMGYFDHSHMNYEFKRISGESPSYFR